MFSVALRVAATNAWLGNVTVMVHVAPGASFRFEQPPFWANEVRSVPVNDTAPMTSGVVRSLEMVTVFVALAKLLTVPNATAAGLTLIPAAGGGGTTPVPARATT